MTLGSEGTSDAYARRVIGPYRTALDHVNAPHALSPEAHKDLALAQLTGDVNASVVSHAHGGLGLLAQHTSYFNGFAVILSLSQATAVALGPGERDSLTFLVDNERIVWGEDTLLEEASNPRGRIGIAEWTAVYREVRQRLLPEDAKLECAVVSSIPSYCMEAFLASLAVSVAQALVKVPGASNDRDLVSVCHEAIMVALGAEFSKAFVMVAAQTVPGKFAIIDTGTEELLHFDAPRRSHMCWGVLDTGSPPHEVAFFHDRGVLAGEALEILQNDGFPELKSFRDVEHRDLPQMLENLPRRLRPIARHLVNENKRVQSMIGAIQKADWQKLGGLLFMSHASLRDEWNGTDAVVDAVVAHIEAQGSEGMYGACMTGRSGTVLMVGQPLALLRSITGLKEMLQADYKKCPKALVL